MCLITTTTRSSFSAASSVTSSDDEASSMMMMKYTELAKMLGRKRSRKQVQFSSEEEATMILPDDHKDDVESNRWYQRTELALFKLEVRDYVLGVVPSADNETNNYLETRGLERYSLERAQNKQIALGCTLLACKKGMTHEEIANVSQTCSSWASNEAFKLACKDYCEVYHPNLVGLMTSFSMPADTPVHQQQEATSPSNNKKRRFEQQQENEDNTAEENSRRVRIQTVN